MKSNQLCACGCGGKTNISNYTDKRIGSKRGEPYKYIRGHSRRKQVNLPSDTVLPSPDWCNWFVGLTDGEGCFIIDLFKNRSNSFRCRLAITLRADDKRIIEEISAMLGGTMNRFSKRLKTNPAIRINFLEKAIVAKIVKLFDTYPLKTKKYSDYVLWRKAVSLWLDARWSPRDIDTIKHLKIELSKRKDYIEE